MPWQQPDYYAVLGIERGASAAEVDRAYRRAARSTHPDTHPDDASAAERFHAVAIAHETLSSPERRAAYDRAHPAARPAAAPVRIMVGRSGRHTDVPPVQLGRRGPQPERPSSPLAQPVASVDGLFELADKLSRLLVSFRFR